MTDDWARRPVNYVTFWNTVRFANWLHNGQPNGTQNALTTEDGAYYVNGYNGHHGESIARKAGSKWFIPSEDEWYKAAYYKGGGTNAGYWSYPTRSNVNPGQDMNDVSGNNANYRVHPHIYPIDNGKYTTAVGEFQNSPSSYNTFDQGGNVAEWNETVPNYWFRGVRGGAFSSSSKALSASGRYEMWNWNPDSYYDAIGFRVGYMPEGWQPVPEPSSLLALAGGICMLFGLRRRRC